MQKKLFLENLGCARNQVDSEVMLGRLERAGWRITDDPARADAIVVNTCSFIEPAADESIDVILSLSRHRTQGRCRRLVVTGCLPERYKEAISEALPEVDVFLGTGGYDRILDAVADGPALQGCILPDPDAVDVSAPEARRLLGARHSAYLKIAEGCDRHCTYCIIPKLRGRQKSRPIPTLVAESLALAAQGVREIVLVAQESTAYGADLGKRDSLCNLLRALTTAVPDVWIRVMYGHPESLTEPIIRAVAELPQVCPYFDVPVQHASEAVLQRMGRHNDKGFLSALFDRIRYICPDAALRTTLITGFPGETEADVEALMDFVERVQFDHLGVFTYSDGEDLPSHGLCDPVDPETAADRRDRVMERQQIISSEKNRLRIGRRYPVLIDEAADPGVFLGRTRFQAPEIDGLVFIDHPGPEPLAVGQVVEVTITDTLEYDLIGTAHVG